MKWFLILFIGGISLLACRNEKNFKISPDSTLTQEAQDSFMQDVIRYIGKLPGKANHSSKFDSSFDAFYNDLAGEHKLEFYFIKENKEHYFLISRIAPSLSKKHVAIGGKLTRNDVGKIIHFEEVFRTWKMPYYEMKTTSEMLFRKMISAEKLDAFYSENQKEDFIIEFPNQDVYYSIEQRRWMSDKEDPLEYYYKIEEQTARDLKLKELQ